MLSIILITEVENFSLSFDFPYVAPGRQGISIKCTYRHVINIFCTALYIELLDYILYQKGQ